MKRPIRLLLQTTIPAIEDDWHIGRFSLLAEHLRSLKDQEGRALCEVTARDRETNGAGDDEILSRLDATDFSELWLFAVDQGDGLSKAEPWTNNFSASENETAYVVGFSDPAAFSRVFKTLPIKGSVKKGDKTFISGGTSLFRFLLV